MSASLVGAFPDLANAAAANCHCEVQCSFPGGGSPFSNTESWSTRADGKKFYWPFGNPDWNDCQNKCSNYVTGLNLEAMAVQRQVCGTVECNSIYWPGGEKKHKRDGISRRIQVACPPKGTGPKENENDSQYSAKFVCGSAPVDNRFVEPGNYKTTINVHNPSEKTVDFRRKVALAALQRDGTISKFVYGKIEPDAVQAFDCDDFWTLAGVAPPSLIDGFLVIESNIPLDVTGYYTSTDARVTTTVAPAIHVEKIAARTIPPRGAFCREDSPTETRIDLADVQNWVVTPPPPSNSNQAVTVTTPAGVGLDPSRPWMSSDSTGAGGRLGNFIYQLDFCACSKSKVTVSGTVRTDDGADATLFVPNTTHIFTVAGPGTPAFQFPTTSVDADQGTGNIVILVQNLTGPTGVSLIGSLTLADGYIGACR